MTRRWEELIAEDGEHDQDERVGVGLLVSRAFRETVTPLLCEPIWAA